MGSKQVILFLMVSFHLYYPLGNTLPSARLQEKVGDKEMDRSTYGGGNGIASRSNFASGVAGRGGSGGRSGGSGGRSVGSGEEGNGGSSTTPKTAGGAAVIPVYTAGAANSHRNYHNSAGSCNRSCVGLPTLCALILASVVLHIYVVLGMN